MLDFRFKIVMLYQNQINSKINRLHGAINQLHCKIDQSLMPIIRKQNNI